jgi:uncharacterized membrane protein
MTKLTARQIEEAANLTAKKKKHATDHFGHAISDEDWSAIRDLRAKLEAPMKAIMQQYSADAAARENDQAVRAIRAAAQAAAKKENQVARAARHALISALPTFDLWAKDRQAAALARADLLDIADNKHVDLAILDLIARHARKLGWAVKRSTGRNGIKSTVYVTPKGRSRVRVSDHTLPQTHTRQLRESMGIRGGWAGEIIVEDMRNASLDDIIKEITDIAEDN